MNKNNEFEILPWHDEFEVGIEAIDTEHKQLVHLVNKLANTLKNDKTFETNEAFKELANYANFHFSSEEKIWKEHLPKDLFLEHKHNHESFLPKITKLVVEHKDKSKHFVIEKILKFLIRWLSFHIISDDKRLAVLVLNLKKGNTYEESERFAQESVKKSIDSLTDILFSLYENLSSNTLILLREKELLNQIERQNLEISNYMDALNKVAIVSKTDLKGVITYVNESFCEASKYSKEELLGKTHNIIRHEDIPKSIFEEIWTTIKNGDTWQGTLKNRTKDGETYYVHSTIFPLFDSEHKIIEYMGIRFLVTQEAQKKRDFKHKVLLTHQQLRKDIKTYKDSIELLENEKNNLSTENEYLIDKLKNSEINNQKFKSQISFYEDKLKESSNTSYDKLINSRKEVQKISKQQQDNISIIKKHKETISNLTEESENKSEEIIRLNEQLIEQNKIIHDLRDTIEYLSADEDDEIKESFLKKLFK